MEHLEIGKKKYQIIKTIKSENKIYYYTIDIQSDNEVVIFQEIDENLSQVDEIDYPKLMNQFALK